MFSELINNLYTQTPHELLTYFSAELWLSGSIVAMLLLRLFGLDRVVPTFLVGLIGAAAAGWVSFGQFGDLISQPGESVTFFGDMLRHDLFSVFFRIFLSLFLILTIALTVLTGIPDNEDAPECRRAF